MEYAPPIFLMSDSNVKQLSGIQYQALRIILNQPLKVSSTEMHRKSKLETFDNRLKKLSLNYFKSIQFYENELMMKLLRNHPNQDQFRDINLTSPINIMLKISNNQI